MISYHCSRSFGMVNFYCRFLPNLSSLLAPLNRLLKDKVQWDWSEDCTHAFATIKKHLSASLVLTHYRNDLPLVLGIGGCLFHILDNGQKKPVYFVSRSLLPAEKNCSQIDREALAIVFAVQRLHQLLYGPHFVLHTDYKPLLGILGKHVGLPIRWRPIYNAGPLSSQRMTTPFSTLRAQRTLWLISSPGYWNSSLPKMGLPLSNQLMNSPETPVETFLCLLRMLRRQ